MNNQVMPSYGLALKVWWSYTWRATLFAMLGAFVFVFALGLVMTIMGVEPPSLLGAIIGALIGAAVSVWVMNRMMTKGFGRYRLVVIEK